MPPSSSTELRLCETCEQLIPEKRLRAVPTTLYCVACLEASGDVPTLKRYDEHVGSVPVQTYYKTPTAYIEKTITRLHNTALTFSTPLDYESYRNVSVPCVKAADVVGEDPDFRAFPRKAEYGTVPHSAEGAKAA